MRDTQPIGQTAFQSKFITSETILGKDDFLRILVTQLRHQDPLNPLKSEEFAAQLAQFSAVEQLHNIRTSLENSIEMDLLMNQALNNTLATTLIGKNVKALGNTVSLGNRETVNLHYKLASPAETVTLQIRDSGGIIVKTVTLKGKPEGNHIFEWHGKDDSGNLLPEGTYTFSVSAVDRDGNSIAANTFIVGLISSIRYENDNAILRVGEQEVNMSDVVEIGI